MFGLGMPEILLILAIALIVIGPKKLPDLAKTLGRAMGEFKKSAQDFKRSIDVETTVNDIRDIVDPNVDLEGIIKGTNTEGDDSIDPKEDTAGSEDIATENQGKEMPEDNDTDAPENDPEKDNELEGIF